ncbi:MAG: hypothetical protein ALECFALPRED_008100 [Alectoria fallacina]|uniref:High affinity methionine permease n=1 Tax=Alectoria fallacina TaxID=1903189 RepID=A0A8H3EU52_9LECA|nr:MAG: hypothetical protein ALECFALPRED_008100 [Alectoria fallacina]
MAFFRGLSRKAPEVEITTTSVDAAPGAVLTEGSLEFIVAQGGNGSLPSYQEASGAPVETNSPLGYFVGPVTVMFLNISTMIGTGVYSTPATILKDTGSVGVALLYWPLGFLISLSSLTVYLEYAACFPNRSGAEVVYLEQAYPRPIYFFPVAFAFQSVILSFSSANSIVLAEYLFAINGHTPSAWELKGVAVAGYTVAVLLLTFHTRAGFLLSNGIGFVKVITLIFIGIAGLVVLGGNTSVQNPTANFHNAFQGTTNSGYGVTNALVKVIFSYNGYQSAFNVVSEVKNPVKTVRNNSFISLLVVAILYQLANIAYFAAGSFCAHSEIAGENTDFGPTVSKTELKTSTQIAASLFFQRVFGSSGAVRGLNFLIALSAFGNLIAVLLGQSRVIRECGRQGVLPFPRFWASTRPFGTPLVPYLVKWAMTILMILAPPAGDAFNFIVDLQVYPASVFALFMAAGLYAIRYRRRKLGLARADFRAWDVSVIFNVAANLFLVIMPWYPPATGRDGGDVSFWYATYVVVGLSTLQHYRIRPEILSLADSAATHRLVKVPTERLAIWESTHDPSGRLIVDRSEKEERTEILKVDSLKAFGDKEA